MRYCPSCGAPNQEDSAFCANCGTSLAGQWPPGPGSYPQQYQGGHTYPYQQAPPPRAPGVRAGVVVMVIAVVAILIIAAVGIVLVMGILEPKVPSAISPGDGDTVDGHYPTFTWTDVPGADRYQVVVTGEGNEEVLDKTVTDTEAVSDQYLEDGIYEWTVRARLEGTWSAWSSGNTFFVGSSTINRHYEWRFDGRTWQWDMMIPGEEYMYYHNQPRTYDYASYMTEDDEYVMSLSQELKELAEEQVWSSYQLVSFTLSFVQSLEYTPDDVSTGYDEYPRYPLETLVDEGGDCEDSSVLFATLLQADPINIDAVLLILPADAPEHMAVGVAGGAGLHGAYYDYDGRMYYYCETTGAGWTLGEIPPEYAHAEATIIQV